MATAACLFSVLAAAAIASAPGWIIVSAMGGFAIFAMVLFAPPEIVLGVALLIIGTYQLSDSHPFHLGSMSVYSTDLLLGLVLIRAVSRRDRHPVGLRMHPVIVILGFIVAATFLYADWRGRQTGLPLRSLVRMPMALIYFPGYIFSFGRLLRERSLDLPRLYGILASVGFAFVLFMLASRIAGKTFDTTSSFTLDSHGYKVVTADGTVLRRDYGFPSAFVIYPLLALCGLAFAVYTKSRSNFAVIVTVAGALATLLTLIRGEIFGLLFGAVALYAAVPKGTRGWSSRRGSAVVVAVAATVLGAFAISVSSPSLAAGVAERALPGMLKQGSYAEKTAADRVHAFSAGYELAAKHPLGIGFRDANTLAVETGVDPLFVTHSTPAYLFVFTGWFGFVATALLLTAMLLASFFASSREPWHHPAYVASMCFFLVYSFSTFGLVGQPWVMAVAAFLVAFRFTVPPEVAA